MIGLRYNLSPLIIFGQNLLYSHHLNYIKNILLSVIHKIQAQKAQTKVLMMRQRMMKIM